MGDPAPEVFVAVFDDESRADRTDRDLAAIESEGLIELLAAAVVARDGAGEARWRVRGSGIRHLSARADTIATMLGVLLPSRVLLAGLTAAADPGDAGREAEHDFGDLFLREVADAVPPGGSVFIGVIDDRWLPEVERGLRGYHRLSRRSDRD
jgi:uncharacterized membrane protein